MKQSGVGDSGFAVMTLAIIVIAHAVAYLLHEYSHSTVAWLLGFMSDPSALDYGGITPGNVVLLADVGDNVPYQAIFGSGHDLAAATVALAGPVIGNVLPYVVVASVRRHWRSRSIVVRSFIFWFLVMSAGNTWSYVPIRAITTHADVAIAARGMHVGVIALFPFVFLPALALILHFFARICPSLIPQLAGHRSNRVVFIIAATVAWFFTFYGGVGLSGSYGQVSQAFSIVSAILLMPCAAMWLWKRTHASPYGPVPTGASDPA